MHWIIFVNYELFVAELEFWWRGRCIWGEQDNAFSRKHLVPALPARWCLAIGDHDQWVPGSVDWQRIRWDTWTCTYTDTYGQTYRHRHIYRNMHRYRPMQTLAMDDPLIASSKTSACINVVCRDRLCMEWTLDEEWPVKRDWLTAGRHLFSPVTESIVSHRTLLRLPLHRGAI